MSSLGNWIDPGWISLQMSDEINKLRQKPLGSQYLRLTASPLQTSGVAAPALQPRYSLAGAMLLVADEQPASE